MYCIQETELLAKQVILLCQSYEASCDLSVKASAINEARNKMSNLFVSIDDTGVVPTGMNTVCDRFEASMQDAIARGLTEGV